MATLKLTVSPNAYRRKIWIAAKTTRFKKVTMLHIVNFWRGRRTGIDLWFKSHNIRNYLYEVGIIPDDWIYDFVVSTVPVLRKSQVRTEITIKGRLK